jgi:hypothetical protein
MSAIGESACYPSWQARRKSVPMFILLSILILIVVGGGGVRKDLIS